MFKHERFQHWGGAGVFNLHRAPPYCLASSPRRNGGNAHLSSLNLHGAGRSMVTICTWVEGRPDISISGDGVLLNSRNEVFRERVL